jgi:hypothetical protein
MDVLLAMRTARANVVRGTIGTLAMLIKPTTAHIGISSFLFLLLSDRSRLRDYRVE